MTLAYALQVPPRVERRLSALTAAEQKLIRLRLKEVLHAAAACHALERPPLVGPPLRFYAGAYRIFYRVERATLRVVLLKLEVALT